MTRIPVRRAIISVADKTGLLPFARRLSSAGVEIVSSGGTADALEADGVAVTRISEVTGFRDVLGGRVKTLHPSVHGAILADPTNPGHVADLEGLGVDPVQLVVVNLYPFVETISRPGVTLAQAIEQIDIGGPTMIRAAAKNHAAVGVVVGPDQYAGVADAVEQGGLDAEHRRTLAREAFFHTAAYDAAIVGYLEGDLGERMVVALERDDLLRYGENPHQAAASYRVASGGGWWTRARQIQGKAMSYNNLADAEAAWRLANDLSGAAAVVVKHMNPCGAAEADGTFNAFSAAWDCDPLSAFGGVIALREELDEATARALADRFVEVVIAPSLAPGTAEILALRPALRVLEAPVPDGGDLDMRRVDGGMLVQERDVVDSDPATWELVAGPQPAPGVLDDLRFAWAVTAHTRSNAIVVSHGLQAVGVGAGDQSRVGAAERALARAGDRASGGVAASDAFFPFRDGLDVLADAGITAIVEPGGSRKDDEVIDAAEEREISLFFAGRRHFRH
ncbi:bifunctional phosphoribosylaminoimidazolecarboxamide formyltransferase/IMP cyclohydrolase [bacterium]|nr:bifunctional phosphoribosylaminoimidazolecarboxamide formyltransferase/IMP cyclohydrolase [bacterium]